MYGAMTKSEFGAHMTKLTEIPEGFTTKLVTERFGTKGDHNFTYVVKSEEQGIEIVFDQYGGGHTNFKVEGQNSWLTFDQRGISDSFYHHPQWEGDTREYDLNALFKEQLQRISDQREYLKVAKAVPGIPFKVSPDRLVNLKAQLKKGKPISFVPGGFGIGYQISSKKFAGFVRASGAMEDFFGVQPLFIQSIECD